MTEARALPDGALATDHIEVEQGGAAIVTTMVTEIRRDAPAQPDQPGLTLARYAAAKKLPEDFLRQLGLRDVTLRDGLHAVSIPYFDEDSAEVGIRYRLALDGADRFRWKKGTKLNPYGLWQLSGARQTGCLIVVEGESDVSSLWYHQRPALGIPGAGTWREEWAHYLDGIPTIFVVVEPDGGGQKTLEWIAKSKIKGRVRLVRLDPFKDPSALHLDDPERFKARLDAALSSAIPWAEHERAEKQRAAAELQEACAPILASADPLELVKTELARLYGGRDVAPPEIAYLAATTRVLTKRAGALPCHLLILGVASSGKSWTVTLVLRLLPEDAFVKIDAGSPRSLIYSDADFQHRVLVYSEADSLPSNEDNPVASAIRTMLQEGELSWDVVVRDPTSGKFVTHRVRKPGPTPLLTTSVRRLPDQLDSRCYTLEAPEDVARVRAALVKQGQLELHPPTAPDPALVAYQAYLQALAPWDVIVPFAEKLAKRIGRSMTEPRIVRDYTKLLALVKSVTVMRHAHRERNGDGRLIATVQDYETVRDLVNPIFEAAATRASVRLRETVEAVKALAKEHKGPVTVVAVARHLKIARSSAHGRIRRALDEGWLKNTGQWRAGVAFDLILGEPMPERTGLPETEEIAPIPREPVSMEHVRGTGGPSTRKTPERPNGPPENDRRSAPLEVGERKTERLQAPEESGETGQPFGRSADSGVDDTPPLEDRSGTPRTVPERSPNGTPRTPVPARLKRTPVPTTPRPEATPRPPRTPVQP